MNLQMPRSARRRHHRTFLPSLVTGLLFMLVLSLSPYAAAQEAAVESSGKQETWLLDLQEAAALAKSTDRNILVNLYAEWCGWCKQLEKKVFPDPKFRDFAQRFVLLRLDVEKEVGAEMQARYRASSLPTTLILSPKLVHVGQVSGYAPADAYIGYIQAELARWQQDQQRYDRLMESRDEDVLLALAREVHKRGDGARAVLLYRRLLDASPSSIEGHWLQYVLADALRLDGQMDAARRQLEEGRRRAAKAEDEEILEALDLLRVQIARDQDDCRGTVRALEEFLAQHPESSHRQQARESLETLKTVTCT